MRYLTVISMESSVISGFAFSLWVFLFDDDGGCVVYCMFYVRWSTSFSPNNNWCGWCDVAKSHLANRFRWDESGCEREREKRKIERHYCNTLTSSYHNEWYCMAFNNIVFVNRWVVVRLVVVAAESFCHISDNKEEYIVLIDQTDHCAIATTTVCIQLSFSFTVP